MRVEIVSPTKQYFNGAHYWKGKNERYYPISNPETEALYDKYKQAAEKIEGLYFIGRLGKYKYYNMDKAAESVFELFKTLQG